MQIPLATSIETRDGSLSKGAKLVNCFVDLKDGASFVVKRPGLRKSVASAAGAGLGMVSWEGNMYHAVGSTFYQTAYASIPSGGSCPPAEWRIESYGETPGIQVQVGQYIYQMQMYGLASDGTQLFMYGSEGLKNYFWTSIDGNTWNLKSDAPVSAQFGAGGRMIYFKGALWRSLAYYTHRSIDGGATWSLVQETIDGYNAGVSIMSGGFVAANESTIYKIGNTSLFSSSDGVNWVTVGDAPQMFIGSNAYGIANMICHGGKIYVLLSNNSVSPGNLVLAYSENFATWSYSILGPAKPQPFIASGGNNLFLITGSGYNYSWGKLSVQTIDPSDFSLSPVLASRDGEWNQSAYTTVATNDGVITVCMRGFDNTRAYLDKIHYFNPVCHATPPYSYAFTTATPGLPLSWVGTSPGTYTKKMFIKNEEKAWTLTLGTPGVLTQVTDPDYPAATVPGAVYLDGYFFVMDKDGTVYNCDLENPDSWNALNYITAEAEWDKGVAIAKHQNYVVALKDWTCELFYDAANPTGSPLSKVSNATVQIGCAQGYSTVQFHGGLIFMSKTRERGRSVHFFPPNSIDPQEIASASIQRILNAADLTTVRAWGGKLGGHILYVLNLVTANISLVYDFTSQTWAQWTSDNAGTEGYFKYGFYATDGNRDYLLHETTGEIFTFTPDVYQDDGADIKVLCRTKRIDTGGTNRKTMRALTVVGDELQTTVSVSLSDDDYQTFSAPRDVSLDTLPPRLLRLGMFRSRSFDVRHVDNTPLRLARLDADIEQAR